MRMDPGGTANLAVLGGNLPPSFGTGSAHAQGFNPGAPRAVASCLPQPAGGLIHPDLCFIVPAELDPRRDPRSGPATSRRGQQSVWPARVP